MSPYDPNEILPIRDYDSFMQARRFRGKLHSRDNLSEDEDDLLGDLNEAIKLYIQYCPPGELRPKPASLVTYLVRHVVPAPTPEILKATSIREKRYDNYVMRGGSLTVGEKRKLAEYFQINPEALEE